MQVLTEPDLQSLSYRILEFELFSLFKYTAFSSLSLEKKVQNSFALVFHFLD